MDLVKEPKSVEHLQNFIYQRDIPGVISLINYETKYKGAIVDGNFPWIAPVEHVGSRALLYLCKHLKIQRIFDIRKACNIY